MKKFVSIEIVLCFILVVVFGVAMVGKSSEAKWLAAAQHVASEGRTVSTPSRDRIQAFCAWADSTGLEKHVTYIDGTFFVTLK